MSEAETPPKLYMDTVREVQENTSPSVFGVLRPRDPSSDNELIETRELLEKKTNDLELAARLGKALLEENTALKREIEDIKYMQVSSGGVSAQFKQVQAENSELKNKLNALELKYSDLESRYALRVNEAKLATVQLTEARTRLEDVETKLANATKKLSQQQDYVETAVSMQDQLAKVTQELQDSKNKEMQQIKAITQLNQDIHELSERLGFRNAEEEERKKKEQADYIAQLKAERENAMIELGKKNKQNAQLVEELDSAVKQMQSFAVDVDSLKDENVFLRKQVETKERLLDSARKAASVTSLTSTPPRKLNLKEQMEASQPVATTDPVSVPVSAEIDPFDSSPPHNTPLSLSSSVTNLPMYFPPPSPSSSSPATPGRSTASGEDDQKLAIYLEQKQKIEELHQKLERTAEQILVRSAILGDKVSSLSQPAAELPKKEGYMTKQGGWVKSWKRRFFYFESEALYYAEEARTRFDTKGMILLRNATAEETQASGKANVFAITTPTRRYFMYTDTPQEMNEWLTVINARIEHIRQTYQPPK